MLNLGNLGTSSLEVELAETPQAVAWPNLATSCRCRDKGRLNLRGESPPVLPCRTFDLHIHSYRKQVLPRGLGTFAVAGGEADAPGARAHAGAGPSSPRTSPHFPKGQKAAKTLELNCSLLLRICDRCDESYQPSKLSKKCNKCGTRANL